MAFEAKVKQTSNCTMTGLKNTSAAYHHNQITYALYYYSASGSPAWLLLYDFDYSSAASLKRGADVHSGTFVIDDLKEIAGGSAPSYRFYGQINILDLIAVRDSLN